MAQSDNGTDWEARYQAGEAHWDKGRPAPPLVDYLRDHPSELQGRVLVPGCGLGHDVRALAAAGLDVVGFDIAPTAVDRAKARPPVGSERYELGNFFELPGAFRGAFDWVFEHTCFCAIDPSLREDYVRAAASALKPEGRLLAIFYMEPDAEQGPPFRSDLAELHRLFGPAFVWEADWVPTSAYPGREGRERMAILRKRL
ncbi:MAG TPA: methyltransferase domain-containing protein [Candidatus Methylacidiphilales bacterium]